MSCDVIEVIVSGSSGPVSVVDIGHTDVHNSLNGLQGGVSGEYFHLTSGQHSSLIDFQSKNFILSGTTTGAEIIQLYFDETGLLNISTGQNILFEGKISAYDLVNFKSAAWDFNCLLANKTGVTQKVGLSQVFNVADDSSGIWKVYINSGSGVDYLEIKAQGQASSTIKWLASVETISIS